MEKHHTRYVLAFLTLSVAGSGVLPGQTRQDTTVDVTTTQLEAAYAKQKSTAVRVVGPTAVTIDPATKTATVRLYNPQADTAAVEVSLQFAPPVNAKPVLADALLEEDAVTADSLERAQARLDSLGKIWSLDSWVKEPLPTQLWIAPHQTVTLTLHLDVPKTLAPGEYSVHVVVATMIVADVTEQFARMLSAALGGAGVSGKAVMILPTTESQLPRAAVKLVYRAGTTVE